MMGTATVVHWAVGRYASVTNRSQLPHAVDGAVWPAPGGEHRHGHGAECQHAAENRGEHGRAGPTRALHDRHRDTATPTGTEPNGHTRYQNRCGF